MTEETQFDVTLLDFKGLSRPSKKIQFLQGECHARGFIIKNFSVIRKIFWYKCESSRFFTIKSEMELKRNERFHCFLITDKTDINYFLLLQP